MPRSRANKRSNTQCSICQQATQATYRDLELPVIKDSLPEPKATSSRATQPQAMRLIPCQQTSNSLLVSSRLGGGLPVEDLPAASLLRRDLKPEDLPATSPPTTTLLRGA